LTADVVCASLLPHPVALEAPDKKVMDTEESSKLYEQKMKVLPTPLQLEVLSTGQATSAAEVASSRLFNRLLV
jgi:hypothetical protein